MQLAMRHKDLIYKYPLFSCRDKPEGFVPTATPRLSVISNVTSCQSIHSCGD